MVDQEMWTKASVIRGNHISKKFWMPCIGEELPWSCEEGNVHDKHTVAVRTKADDVVAGHAPREMSHVFWFFIQHGGEIQCKMTGKRKLGKGLEVRCTYHFSKKKKLVDKLKTVSTQQAYIELPIANLTHINLTIEIIIHVIIIILH